MWNHRVLFGDEDAERDELLFDCEVKRTSIKENKPILKGKWGTGKSAILILHNKELELQLKDIDTSKKRIWYMDEKTLDIRSLLNLRKNLKEDPSSFNRALEGIWEAEIIRVYCELLNLLSFKFSNTSSSHWSYIKGIQAKNTLSTPIWGMLEDAFRLMSKDTPKIIHNLSAYFDKKTYENIQKCLNDIPDSENYMCIAIEPIDTPASEIEEKGLAQPLITALLNVYEKKFAPSINQKMRVRLSLPWHRYEPLKLDFPQKLEQYMGDISWTKEKLREFINKRIGWEFKKVNRQFKVKPNQDEFSILFEPQIRNQHCEPKVLENTFDYILRHTHHRARNLQRLIRRCVEEDADSKNKSLDDILKREKISEKTIIDVLKTEGRKSTKQLLAEGNRTFPDLEKIINTLQAISIPFNANDINKRLKYNNLNIKLSKAMDILWKSGFLGVMVYPNNRKTYISIRNILEDVKSKKYNFHFSKNNELKTCWNFFDYNCDKDVNTIIKTIENFAREDEYSLDYGLILHPKTFEYFGADVTKTYPLGI